MSQDTLSPLTGDGDQEVLELDRSGNVQRRWLHASNGEITPVPSPNNLTLAPILTCPQILIEGQSSGLLFHSLRQWRKAFRDAFLPVGYPHSVSPDYLAYQTYDSLQAFFSTITSLLANRALLEGLGVGDADSSATFAMLLTIMKDAMSRIATIVFAHQFGLRIEPEAKRFRFLADVFNDTAFFLELYSPFLSPWAKITALCTGEALRALCGVAAGASKAALSAHFAKQDNLAELNAKEASQETAVGLVGLLVGTLVVRYVQNHRIVVYLMTVLVFAHLWMNYLGVRAVCMNTLNRQRATILFKEYIDNAQVLTPREVAARESILFWKNQVLDHHQSHLGTITFAQSWPHANAFGEPARPRIRTRRGDDPKFWVYTHSTGLSGVTTNDLRIVVLADATPKDVINSWYFAMFIARCDAVSLKGYSGEEHVFADGFEKLAAKMVEAGWSLETQGLEMHSPLRMRFTPTVKKEQ